MPDLGPEGTALHAAITAEFDIGPADVPLVESLCRTADALATLAGKLRVEPGSLQLLRAHNSAALTYARLRASLGLHVGEDEDAKGRPGVYAPSGTK